MAKITMSDLLEVVLRECATNGIKVQEFSEYLQTYCKRSEQEGTDTEWGRRIVSMKSHYEMATELCGDSKSPSRDDLKVTYKALNSVVSEFCIALCEAARENWHLVPFGTPGNSGCDSHLVKAEEYLKVKVDLSALLGTELYSEMKGVSKHLGSAASLGEPAFIKGDEHSVAFKVAKDIIDWADSHRDSPFASVSGRGGSVGQIQAVPESQKRTITFGADGVKRMSLFGKK